jgi:RecA-family ATPase
MNRKGDEVDDRVYRMAKIIEIPENLIPVPKEKLKELAGKLSKKETVKASNDAFDLDNWISRYCPEAEGPHSWKDGRKWILPICPFNPEHDNRSAVITQQHNGAIGFRCLHNSCLNKDWKTLRKLKEPEKIPITLPSVDLSGIMSKFQKEEKKKSILLPVNAAEWIKVKLPPTVPIVKDFIDKGNKIQLIGDSKLGKSWFNLNLALSIATGRKFLHWQIPNPRKVLLVQLEIGAVYYQERLKFVSNAMGIEDEDLYNLSIINGRGLPPLTEGQIFHEFLEVAANYDVIFIDPLYKVHSGDENKAEDMKRPLLAFDRICEISGAAVIYTHHNPKGLSGDRKLVDRGSGSAVLGRDYDGMISLSPHVQEGLLVLEALTRNHPDPRAFTLIRDGLFRIVDIEPQELTSRTANERKKTSLLEAMICVKDAKIIRPGELLKAEEVDDRLVSICDLPVRMARTVRGEMTRQGEWKIETGERNAKLYKCGEIH